MTERPTDENRLKKNSWDNHGSSSPWSDRKFSNPGVATTDCYRAGLRYRIRMNRVSDRPTGSGADGSRVDLIQLRPRSIRGKQSSLEIFHHPDIAAQAPSLDGEMKAVGRWNAAGGKATPVRPIVMPYTGAGQSTLRDLCHHTRLRPPSNRCSQLLVSQTDRYRCAPAANLFSCIVLSKVAPLLQLAAR